MSENKRVKQCNLNEDSGGNPIDEESTGQDQEPNKSDDDLIQDEDGMPTLVAKIFIESITDVELLKKCRIINKYWNFEACAALRQLSFVTLSLNNKIDKLFDKLKQFEDFVVVENSGRSLSLPSPFKHVSVFIRTLSKYQDILPVLFNSPNLEIKSLFIYLDKITALGQLNELLKPKAAEITEMELLSNIHSKRNTLTDLHEVLSEIKLPNLRALNMLEISCRDIGEDCDHVDLIREVTAGSPLTSLKLQIGTSCFPSFLSMDFTRITKLNLEFQFRLEKKHCDLLAAAQLPSLKSLQFCDKDQSFLTQRRSFYMNVSSTVEYLKLHSVNVLGTGVYPKLKSLTIEKVVTTKDLRNITQEKFPHLREINVATYNRNYFPSLEINPHEGVQKLCAFIEKVDENENMPLDRTGITALASKFPNVRDLDIHLNRQGELWKSELQNVYQAYPHLNSLAMHGFILFDTLAGATIQELNSEWPEQNFPRMVSIVDFQSLESLYVDPGTWWVDNEAIQYCFGRMPNLKHLKIPWDRENSLEVVGDFLQHLVTLEISNAYNTYHTNNILIDLQTVLPRTTVKKTRVDKYYL